MPDDPSGQAPSPGDRSALARRGFLLAGTGAIAALVAACGGDGSASSNSTTTTSSTTSSTTTAPPPGTSTAPVGPAAFVSSGPATRDRIALTFHTDGDLALAQQMLDALAAADLRITAFVVGRWLDANPSWARKLLDAGHELANHTATHPSFETLGPAAMRAEIAGCRDTIERLTGGPGAFFRPSGTDDGVTVPSAAVLESSAAEGYPIVLGYDDDPLDYRDPGATVVVQRTLDAARAGGIVSLHFGHPGTVAAIPGIASGLRAKGLTPVTASQLLP